MKLGESTDGKAAFGEKQPAQAHGHEIRAGDLTGFATMSGEIATLQSFAGHAGPSLESLTLAGAYPPATETANRRGLALAVVQLAHAARLLAEESPAEPTPARANGLTLIDQAVAGIALAAGLDAPPPIGHRRPDASDPTLDTVFAEYDRARAKWEAMPSEAVTWRPKVEVDQFLAAEQALLGLADARREVLERQADVLLDLTEDFTDQLGPATANAIANVAQGLLDEFDRAPEPSVPANA
jgi:hypothetical protein